MAGGACIKWFNSQTIGHSDIDIFCRSADQAIAVLTRIKNYNRYEIIVITDNATTLKYFSVTEPGRFWILQVITVKYFTSIQEVIDGFDISVCQIATAGNEWVLGEGTAKDLHTKTLRFVGPLKGCSLKRMIKYWTYGYEPSTSTIAAIQESPNTIWKADHVDMYDDFRI